MSGCGRDDITAEELERQRALYGPFTQAVRELVDATSARRSTTTRPGPCRQRSRRSRRGCGPSSSTGPYRVRFGATGRGRPWGNTVVGLRAEARIDRSEDIKTRAKGHLMDAEGVTVEAEGLFVLPRWAREAISAQADREGGEGERATPRSFE